MKSEYQYKTQIKNEVRNLEIPFLNIPQLSMFDYQIKKANGHISPIS